MHFFFRHCLVSWRPSLSRQALFSLIVWPVFGVAHLRAVGIGKYSTHQRLEGGQLRKLANTTSENKACWDRLLKTMSTYKLPVKRYWSQSWSSNSMDYVICSCIHNGETTNILAYWLMALEYPLRLTSFWKLFSRLDSYRSEISFTLSVNESEYNLISNISIYFFKVCI